MPECRADEIAADLSQRNGDELFGGCGFARLALLTDGREIKFQGLAGETAEAAAPVAASTLWLGFEAFVTSKPAVNARSPAPEMMMARVSGSWEKKLTRPWSSYHMGL